MAMWTGLGDNTELFWAVLSQQLYPVEFLGNNTLKMDLLHPDLIRPLNTKNAL
jgi:hypothetical protein